MEKMSEQKILPEGYFYHNEGYLWHVLPVEKFLALPETVKLEDEEFTKKQEFHVTVANVRAMAEELARTEEEINDIEESIQKLLAEYVQDNPIIFKEFTDDLRLAVTEERKSIAARCRMSGVEGYFDLIKQKYNKEFPLQPAHVSIYTVNGMAVGINSDEQMESYSKVVLPEVQNILSSVEA